MTLSIVPDEPPDADEAAGREPLDVSTEATTIDWLRDNLGTGQLAGYFRRGAEVVLVPSLQPDNTVQTPATDLDRAAPIRVATVDNVSSRVQALYWPHKMVVKGRGDAKYIVPEAAVFPDRASRHALASPDLLTAIRDLRGVVRTPIARADGTVLHRAGYDDDTQLLLLPDVEVPPVPDTPTQADVTAARKLLEHMLTDFRFLSDHDRANYLGLMLTPLLREIAPSPYKLGIIQARQKGSGKSYLATALRTIHGGLMKPEVPDNDDELRKQITSILTGTAEPVVTWDNVTSILRSGVLAMLFTTRTWTDRPLGRTADVAGLNDRLWTCTGNNVRLGGDLNRRAVWVTIDPQCAKPWERTKFTIANFLGWVEDNRARLLHALLVLIRAWAVAGRPTGAAVSSDDYARWVQVVGGILAHAGVKGVFCHPDTDPQEIGEDDVEWADFITAAQKEFRDEPWTARDLLELVHDGRPVDPQFQNSYVYQDAHPIPLDVLPAELVKGMDYRRGPSSLAKKLGWWLRNRDGQYAGAKTIRKHPQMHRTGVAQWFVQGEVTK